MNFLRRVDHSRLHGGLEEHYYWVLKKSDLICLFSYLLILFLISNFQILSCFIFILKFYYYNQFYT